MMCKRSGVTLVEILAVVLILGIVAAQSLPRIWPHAASGKKNSCYVNKGEIDLQVQLWYRNKGTWPANNLSDIAADTSYFPQGLPQCPVDSTSYTLNGTTHEVTGHTH